MWLDVGPWHRVRDFEKNVSIWVYPYRQHLWPLWWNGHWYWYILSVSWCHVGLNALIPFERVVSSSLKLWSSRWQTDSYTNSITQGHRTCRRVSVLVCFSKALTEDSGAHSRSLWFVLNCPSSLRSEGLYLWAGDIRLWPFEALYLYLKIDLESKKESCLKRKTQL